MSTLSPVEEDSALLSPEELQAQREWDEEFQRRKEDLARQQLKSRERRQAVSEKMADLRNRWQGVERRRELRSREGRGSNSSVTLAVPATGGGSQLMNNDSSNSDINNSNNSDINNNNDHDSREESNINSGLNR